jgi:hypothetical protein
MGLDGDRDEVGALLFVNPVVIRTLGLTAAALRAHLQRALMELRSTSTATRSPTRVISTSGRPSPGAAHVEELYAGGPGAITA